MKKSMQTIVSVPHQELIDLKELLEQFASWEEPLSLFNQFFTFQQNQPLNKKKLSKNTMHMHKSFIPSIKIITV